VSTESPSPFLIVGLGNPGREYRLNRHNMGFMVIDQIVERHQIAQFTKKEGRALITKGTINGLPAILAKPQTYMNLSGEAVASLVNFYNVSIDHLIVAVDDINIPFGTLRLRPRGSAGGQRGLQSIVNALGTEKFARLRLGIGRPPGRMGTSNYVLQDFKTEDMDMIELMLDRSVDIIETWMKDGVVLAMSRYNGPADREG
jgi:PTH1 family peptidyl-tRNA hydrolase